MPAQILVTGATGQVGGAVARRLIEQGHRVRALVRDLSSDAARDLARRGVELVEGDLVRNSDCRRASRGVDAIFLVTTPAGGVHREVALGFNMIDAAEAEGVGQFVFSSVADAESDTGIPHFDSKAAILARLRETRLRWTAVAPVFFFENFLFPWTVASLREGVLRQPLPADRPLQMIAVADIAAFVALVIDDPNRWAGQHVGIASDELTMPQVARTLSDAIGRPVAYVEQDPADLDDTFEDMALMYRWFDTDGFSVDIGALHEQTPQLTWTSFSDWVRNLDRAALAA